MITRDKYVRFTSIVRDGAKGWPEVPFAPPDIPAITTEAGEYLSTQDDFILLWETGSSPA